MEVNSINSNRIGSDEIGSNILVDPRIKSYDEKNNEYENNTNNANSRSSRSTLRKSKAESQSQANINQLLCESNIIESSVQISPELQKIVNECKNNKYGWPPVTYAAALDDLEALKYLVTQGYDINSKFPTMPVYNENTNQVVGYQEGLPPIVMAVMVDNVDMVKYLVDKKAEVNFDINFGFNIDCDQDNNGIPTRFFTEDSSVFSISISLIDLANALENSQIIDLITKAK